MLLLAALGFSDEQLVEAAIRQLTSQPPHASGRTVPAVMELTERLAAIAPVKMHRIYRAATASEANDHLIKFMWLGNDFAGEPQHQDDFAKGKLPRQPHRRRCARR